MRKRTDLETQKRDENEIDKKHIEWMQTAQKSNHYSLSIAIVGSFNLNKINFINRNDVE